MQPINSVKASWNTTAMTKYFLLGGTIILLIMSYSGISRGGLLLSICLLSATLINPIAKKFGPVFEAYVDIGIICFFAYNSYYFYREISIILLLGLTAMSVIRIVMHSFMFRKESRIWSLGLHLLPLSTAALFILNVKPDYSIPLPTTLELMIIGTTSVVAFAVLFMQTIYAYINTLNYIETSKEDISNSYTQVLELNQILSHNLRTPLATALGQLEIAGTYIKDNKNILKAKEALSQVVTQTSSVNNAKKAFSQSETVLEFLENWKEIFQYEMVKLNLNGDKDEYKLTEQVAIALAISLDIFGQNSLEANADVLVIDIKSRSQRLHIQFLDNGDGAKKETLEMLGKPMSSGKKHGAGLGTYLAKRLLLSSGAKVNFANRSKKKGFEVHIEI